MHPTAEQLRIYADTTNEDGTPNAKGVAYGALTIVKRTTANCCKREGTTHQYNLYAEVRRVWIDFTTATTERATDTAKYSHDIQDMLSVARLAILQAIAEGQPLDTQYGRAYKELNKYLYDSRAIQVDTRPNHYSIEQLTDKGVEVVQVWKDINILLTPDTRYTAPNYEDEDNGEDAKRKAIKMLVATLSPVQLQVLKCLAKGMSQRATAEHMHRNIKTIADHIAIIRKKAVETFTRQCPEVIPQAWTDTDTANTIAKGKRANK